jgi:hypothetical protein
MLNQFDYKTQASNYMLTNVPINQPPTWNRVIQKDKAFYRRSLIIQSKLIPILTTSKLYPDLVSFSYSPPGGLLKSIPAMEMSKEFTSVVLGKTYCLGRACIMPIYSSTT